MSDAEEIRLRQQDWEDRRLRDFLKDAPEREMEFTTRREGIPVKRLYTPLDLEQVHFDYLRDLSFPGEYPYTRCTTPTGYRGKLYAMSQSSGFGSSEDTNKRWRYLLEHGTTGLVIQFDLPTQLGLDSDHPMARGEVGRLGLAINSLSDFEAALDIPLEKVRHIHVVNNAMSAVILAMLVAVFEKKRVSTGNLYLVIQNEILKEFFCRGQYVFPPAPSLRLATDVIEYCVKKHPDWHPLSIIGAQYGSSGATPSQEAGFALANAFAYIEAAIQRGIDVDSFAGKIEFCLSSQMDMFEEAAKMRAARKLWAKLVKERFGAKSPASLTPTMLCSGSGITQTAQQPLNNIVRLTIQCLGAVLGGADNITLPSYDEALGIPTAEATRVTSALHNIVAYESGVTNTVDPLAGSYYVETLTKKMEEEIVKVVHKIDELGGVVKAIEKRYFQQEMAKGAYRWQRDLEQGKRIMVGINMLAEDEETTIAQFQLDPEVERRQIERLQRFRRQRDGSRVARAIHELKEAAEGPDNLIPCLIEAVKADVTIGEIRNTLTDVFGEYREDLTRIG